MTVDFEAIPAAGVEQRLGFGTYLVTQLLRSGRPVGLKIGTMEIAPENSRQHKLLLLKILAMYGTD